MLFECLMCLINYRNSFDNLLPLETRAEMLHKQFSMLFTFTHQTWIENNLRWFFQCVVSKCFCVGRWGPLLLFCQKCTQAEFRGNGANAYTQQLNHFPVSIENLIKYLSSHTPITIYLHLHGRSWDATFGCSINFLVWVCLIYRIVYFWNENRLLSSGALVLWELYCIMYTIQFGGWI